jgi:hypothetical protein
MTGRLALTLAALALWLVVGCGSDDAASGAASSSSSATTSSGTGAGGAGGASTSSSGGAGGSGGVAGTGGTGPAPCDPSNPTPPPSSVLWPSLLTGTGPDTLNGHGHDDGKGPVGYCAFSARPGEPYYDIIAVGFESDQDLNADNDENDSLAVDFYGDPASFGGVGESGGRINIYAQVLDDSGVVLSGSTAPELRLVVTAEGGTPLSLPLDNKPANEFQTNYPMVGGGNSYGIAIEGQSDRVFNMRLPNNHHVTFVVVFQRRSS